jgi:diguanylate cyclase (GGDEF)-like protein/PAS domain S-box-containing protein
MAPRPTVLALARNTGGFYHGQLLAGLIRQVDSSGGRVIVAETLDPENDRSDWLGLPAFRVPVAWDNVDAVVSIALGANTEYLRQARAAGKPVVLASHYFHGFDGPVAIPDNYGGVRVAVEHLIDHGHTRIGFVGNLDQHDFRERFDAYKATMAEHGLPTGEDLFFSAASYSKAAGAAAAEALLAAPDRPTAVITANDENAIGLMSAVIGAGLSVPGDLAVIGFDNIEEGAYTVPSLTSVGQRFDEVGALAGRLALSMVAGEEARPGIHTVSAAFLPLRASCGCRNDLVAGRPPGDAHPVPTPRPALRTGVEQMLHTLLRTSAAAEADADITKTIDLLDGTLASQEGSHEDVWALIDALNDLTDDAELQQRVASILSEYAHEVSPGNDSDLQTVGTIRALAALTEFKARGYLFRSRRHDTAAVEVDTIAGGLLRASAALNRSLAWLSGTHVRAGVLALWEGPVSEGRMRVEGVHDPDGLLDVRVGDEAQVRSFPPDSLVDAADGLDGEMCLVVPVASTDHELGLLALLGKVDVTSTRESYCHWAEMLCRALANAELQDAVQASEERYAFAARAANDGLWDWNRVTGRVYLSERCRDLLDIPTDAVPDEHTIARCVHPGDRDAVERTMTALTKQSDAPVQLEFRVRLRDGTSRWVLCRALGVASNGEPPRRIVGSVSDISQRKILEGQLRHAALFDQVTGLPNRQLLLDRLEVAMGHCRRHKNARFAVLFLDLDGFKLINDSLGHLLGDELLRVVAERLRADLRSTDTVARFGGDEFAVLLIDPIHEDLLVAARRVRDRIAAPVRLGGQEISVTASIGVAVSDTGYTSAEDVLRDADIAMYQAKESERGSACLFDPAMHERALDRLRTRTELAAALEEHQFVAHYQPIVDFGGAALTQFEALVRWNHPDRGLLAPIEFLPAMVGDPSIVTLGRQVLDGVCTQIAAWRAAGHPTVTVSVNLSHREFWDPDLLTTIRTTLDRHNVPPQCIALEITETVVMTDPDDARIIMDEFHSMGLQIHMDDFGTGHSSLHLLRTFPFDALKIDGSFVRELGTDNQTAALVRAIIAMGDALDVDVIAECVETLQQAEELQAMGCHTVQGWLYAPALPPADAGRLLDTNLAAHHSG